MSLSLRSSAPQRPAGDGGIPRTPPVGGLLFLALAGLLFTLVLPQPVTAKDKGRGKGKQHLSAEEAKEVVKEKTRERIEEKILGKEIEKGGKSRGKKRGPGKGRGRSGGLPPGLAKKESLPPGLARQKEETGSLPPGLQKREGGASQPGDKEKSPGQKKRELLEKGTDILLDEVEKNLP